MPKFDQALSGTGDYYRRHVQEVLQSLKASESGLSDSEVLRRREAVGPNELIESGGRKALRILWEQLFSALVALLVVAAAASLWLHEYTDAIAILTIVALNTALGFYQDYKAEKALAALKRFDVPNATVRRDGAWVQVSSTELVPGDLIRLTAGDMVPADGRLLEVVNLRAEESTLTGESADVEKQVDVIDSDNVSLGDQLNMVFKGTLVTYGHGVAVVCATGMATELGRIAASLKQVQHGPTPLQRRLGRLGRTLAIIALVIVALVFSVGVFTNQDPRLMLMASLSLAVAIVPEGLPAVATVALALGAMRMFERNALIRRLPAVEALGSVTVICTDKTGTITENRMTVREAHVSGHSLAFASEAAEGAPRQVARDDVDGEALLYATASLCSDVQMNEGAEGGSPNMIGQPTEVALAEVAADRGWTKKAMLRDFPMAAEFAFDSERKRMTTLHHVQPGAMAQLVDYNEWQSAEAIAFTKGAVDFVIDACTTIWQQGRPIAMDEGQRQGVQQAHDRLASTGHRVLAIAVRALAKMPAQPTATQVECDLVLVGLVGLIDPPRIEVRQAVARCRRAGIRPLMITGDHPLTAKSIAQAVGIADGAAPITGVQLAEMSDEELAKALPDVSIFARVAPVDKLRIVGLLEDQGAVVAMTGDGVNDAPALKKADIGVAMGIRGADVSKQAADIVLLDDNFATIVGAVEQGRIVYDNIRKFVQYTMTSNAGEVCVMLIGPLLGMPLPLLPLQILWINLVTDGLPGLALGMEPAERTVMHRPPQPPRATIIDRRMWGDIAWIGLLMGAVSLAAGYYFWVVRGTETEYWRSALFTVLTLAQMGNVLAIRASRDSLFRVGIGSNKPLLGAVLLTLLLQMTVIYVPFMQRVFNTTALAPADLAVCLLVSTAIFWCIEAKKWLARLGRLRSLRQRRRAR